jgi:hypothetical protein
VNLNRKARGGRGGGAKKRAESLNSIPFDQPIGVNTEPETPEMGSSSGAGSADSGDSISPRKTKLGGIYFKSPGTRMNRISEGRQSQSLQRVTRERPTGTPLISASPAPDASSPMSDAFVTPSEDGVAVHCAVQCSAVQCNVTQCSSAAVQQCNSATVQRSSAVSCSAVQFNAMK